MEKGFEWTIIFNEFAWTLLKFKNNREELLKMFYEIMDKTGRLGTSDGRNCNMDTDDNGNKIKFKDIDPFTIMNRLGMYCEKENNTFRIEFLKYFKEKLKLKSDVPELYYGIPTVNYQKSWFFNHINKQRKGEIDELWDLFETSLRYSKDESYENEFIKIFDQVNKKIASALYRAVPDFFISLDNNTISYIKNKFGYDASIGNKSGNDYVNVLKHVKKIIKESECKSIPILSKRAWEEKYNAFETNSSIDFNDFDGSEWLLPANFKSYRHDESFQKNKYIDWRQHNNKYKVGDLVYLFKTSPKNYIDTLCIVEKIDLSKGETIDDSEFKIGNKLSDDYKGKYFRIRKICELDSEKLSLKKLKKYGLSRITQRSRRMYGGLIKYIHSCLPLNNNKLITNYMDINKNILKNKKEDINNNIAEKPKNVIYYGIPGSGKSYEVNSKYCVNPKYYVRTVFHPDYTYTDFIGQIMPVSNDDKSVEYRRIEGPLTKAIKIALENSNIEVSLIIEEINRGPAAAIFGDIFQLLDRSSDYRIENEFIKACCKKFDGKLPQNLNIVATMNTSDQNVFVLDNAFKRRWEFIRVKNELKKDDNRYNAIVAKSNITWNDFYTKINEYILDKNDELLNNEDKRLGAYFVTREEIEDAQKFGDKVLMYLWDNIARYNPDNWFKNKIRVYDELIDAYMECDKILNIFCEDLKNKFEENNNNE